MLNITPINSTDMYYSIQNTTKYISPECAEWCRSALPEKCYSYSPVFVFGLFILLIAMTFKDKKFSVPIFIVGLIVTLVGIIQ